jgi:hypothetical protein
VNYLLRAVEVKHIPVIMNFIAKKQVKNIHIIKSISNLLPINIVPEKKFARHEMTALERIISAGMSFTESYIDTNLQFDTSNLDKILMVDGHEANENTVHKMLEYFIDNLATQKRKRVMVSGL